MLNEAGKCRKTFMVDPGVGDRITDSEFRTSLFSYYRNQGFSRNFIWYAPRVQMTVPYQTQQTYTMWSGCVDASNPATGNLSECPGTVDYVDINGNRQATVFHNTGGVTVWVWKSGSSYVSDVCGNFSRDKSGKPVPKISGYKFNDLDGDSIKDVGEPPLSGFTIRLTTPTGQVVTKTTNSSGKYSFPLVGDSYGISDAHFKPGTYTLQEVLPTGWVNTKSPGPVVVNTGIGNHEFANRNFLNYKKAEVHGAKFNDLDGDGARDSGEPGIPGWPIFLDGTAGSGQAVHLTKNTDGNGNYHFTGLKPGSYVLTEGSEPTNADPDDQWVQSFPPSGQYPANLISGQILTGRNLGNYELGSISGTKFHDNDGYGEFDDGEEGLPGWTINLDGTTGSGEPVSRSEVTDENGDYKFDKLHPGQYWVSEKPPPAGWVQTHPNPKAGDARLKVPLTSGQDEEDVDFGNAMLGSIGGTKYHDLDADGERDTNEPGLPGWTINLTGKTARGNQVALSAETDENGDYLFPDLEPGKYTVSEKHQKLWHQTAPQGGSHWVPLKSGQDAEGIDFGNFAGFAKTPPLRNLFLTRQGDKVPPVTCLLGDDVAQLSALISPIKESPDPKDPSQNQELGAFEFETHYDETKICVQLLPGPAAEDMTCIIEDDVTKADLEGVARIGCVSLGKDSFPDTETEEGRTLAYLLVRPQPELYSQAKPNQGNGVIVQLNNVGCELADLQGHPIPFFKCSDADVTIRYLEGDVTADCSVDALDAQSIAFRWGAHKGDLVYTDFTNLEPSGAQADDDIDIKDLQFVYGRFGSECEDPHPDQPPVNPKS